MEKIGFVGTGAMGSALLSRLKLANVPATAFDIAPAAMEAARKEGAQTATSAKAVAQASTIDRRRRAHRPGSFGLHHGRRWNFGRRRARHTRVAAQYHPADDDQESG